MSRHHADIITERIYMNAMLHTRDGARGLVSCEARRHTGLSWRGWHRLRVHLSASGRLTQLRPLGVDLVVVSLPHHRQPRHELLL